MIHNVQAAGTTNMSRRNLLIALTAASTATCVAAAPEAAATPAATVLSAPQLVEDRAVFAAYAQLRLAQSRLTEAEAALEWLADEWKHLWPLAPEQLLLGTNADKHPGALYGKDSAERDIIGRHIFRDTSELRVRFSKKQRQETPRACFSIATTESARRSLEHWQTTVPKGRTAKSLARNAAFRLKRIAAAEREIELATAYEAQTRELRERAGVAAAKERVAAAKADVARCGRLVASAPVKTPQGLRLKAEALKLTSPEVLAFFESAGGGTLGSIAQLLRDAISIGEAAA